MKKFLRFVLLAALLVPLGARAQSLTLTVADGTATNSTVPVYGLWADDYTRSQMIYPANMIAAAVTTSDMTNGSITGLDFYPSSPASAAWTGTFVVKMMEVSATTLSAWEDVTTATTVYTGALDGTGSTMTITFDSPYTYNGGNLLIEITETTPANYSSCSFYGIDATGASSGGYSSSGVTGVAFSQKNFLPKVTFTYTGGTPVTCPAVSSHRVSAIDSNNATISWVDNLNTGATYTVTYWPTDATTSEDTLMAISNAGDTSLTLTGLSSNTLYYYTIRVNCTESNSVSLGGSFRTSCAMMIIPFSDNFDSYDNGFFPPCWHRIVNHGTDPSVNDQFHHSGAQSMFLLATDDTNLFVTPNPVPLSGDNIYISYWAYMNWSNSYPGLDKWIKVGVMTDTADLSTFIALDSIGYHNFNNVFEHYTANTSNLNPNAQYWVAWMFRGEGSSYNRGAIDDVYIDDLNMIEACQMVRNLVVDTVDANNATLHWTPGLTESAWAVRINEGAWIDVTDTIYTFENLSASTIYTVDVVALCSDTSEMRSVSFRTNCGTVMAPYIDDFSSYIPYEAPNCWTITESSESYYTYPYVTSGNNLYFYPQYQQPNVIAMPHINLPANGMSIAVFAHKSSSGANYVATMEFGYVTSLDSAATFYVIDTMQIASTSASNPDELEFTTALVPSNLDTIYLAFRASTASAYGYGYIDGVEVRRLTNCFRPNAMLLDTVTYNSAILHWDEVASAEGYVVRYATTNNVNAASAVDVEATDTTITLTSLSPSTHYYTWVHTICASDSSDWRQGPDFVTGCGENPCYIVVDMEDSYGDGWNGNAINFIINGNQVASATIPTGTEGTFSQAVCDGDSVVLVWQTGNYSYEASFNITYAGMSVINGASGSGYTNGQTIFTANGCPTCAPPTNIVVDNYDANSITISWTPADEFDAAWVVYLNDSLVDGVSTPTYTFSGLTANTTYSLGVATICTDDTTNPASISAYTDCEDGSCSLTIDMTDSYGDGWNGNAIAVYTDSVPTTYTLLTGSHDVATARLCVGQNVTVTYVRGSFPGEVSFTLTFADGRAIATNASGNSFNSGDTIFTGIAECRSCPSPTALTMTASNGTDATISWNGGEATSWFVSIIDTTGAILSSNIVNTTTHTFTGLTTSTPYTVCVTTICGMEDSSWATTLSINTPCPGVNLPWHDDFMTYLALEETPGCWSTPARTTLSGYTYPLMLGAGRYSVIAASNEDDTMGVAIAATPLLLSPANNLYVRYKLFSATEGDISSYSLEAGIMTNVYDPATFIPVATIPNTDEETQEFEFLTNNLEIAGNAWVAFRAIARNSAAEEGYAAFVLNEVYIQAIPACQRPDSVNVAITAHPTDVDVTLSWPAVTGSTGYTVEIVGDTTFSVTTNSYTMTGVDGNSTFTVRVYNNCSATDRSLPRTVTFTTPCTGYILPYNEGFENFTSAYPECWTRPVQYPNYAGDMSPYISTTSHSGSRSLYYITTNTIQTMAISPALYGQANNVNVGFWVYGSSSAGFVAGIMTDPNVDSTFIPMLTVPATSYNWTYYEFNTDSLTLTDTIFHFALRATTSMTSSYYGLYVDDISVATIPPCSETFASASIDGIGADSALVYFEPGLGRNVAASYLVRVMDVNDQVIDSVETATSPAILYNLTPSTTYHVNVSLICEGGVTAVSNTLVFTTRCAGSTTIEISSPNSTAGNYYPVYPYYNHSASQTIYPDSLLGSRAMSISSLSINCSTGNSTLTGFRGRIWLKEIPDTVNAVAAWMPLDSMTLVYDGNLPLQNGWVEFFFTTPFDYSGHGNLMVCMMADTTFGTYKNGYNFYRHSASSGTTRYIYSDYDGWDDWMADGETGTATAYRTDMRFSTCGGFVCDAPVIDSVLAGENDIFMSFTGAENYEVAIAEGLWNDSVAAAVTPIAVTDTFYTFNGLTAETQYTIGVRAVCGTGLYSDWTTMPVMTAEHPCAVPSNIVVSNVTLNSAVIDWTLGEEETSWELNVTGTNYDRTFTVEDKPYTLTGLNHGVTYTVKVRALCGERHSEWSEPETFTTESCLPVSNVAYSNVTATSVTISWTAPQGINNFELEYGQSGFSQGTGTTVTATGTSTTLTGLTSETMYDVYVRSVCAEGAVSEWSNVVSFETHSEGIDDVAAAAISLYPNPASSTVTLMGIEGMATVTVVDMNGREAGKWTVSDGELTIDVTDMAQGAYFVRIVGEQVNAIRKLIVR